MSKFPSISPLSGPFDQPSGWCNIDLSMEEGRRKSRGKHTTCAIVLRESRVCAIPISNSEKKKKGTCKIGIKFSDSKSPFFLTRISNFKLKISRFLKGAGRAAGTIYACRKIGTCSWQGAVGFFYRQQGFPSAPLDSTEISQTVTG